MKLRTRCSAALLLATAALFRLAGPAAAQAVDRYFPAAGVRRVTLTVDEGQVRCRVADDDQVHLRVHGEAQGQELRPLDVKLVTATRRGELSLTLELHRRPFMRSVNPGQLVELDVPHELRVRVKVLNGSIEARGLDAGASLETVDDDIRAIGCEGLVELVTDRGTAWAVDLVGALRASTREGRIDATGRLSALDARAADGSLDITVTGLADPLPGVPNRAWSVASESGSVKLKLSKDLNGVLRARAPDGALDPGPYRDFTGGLAAPGRPGQALLTARLGSGRGLQIRAASDSGRVILR